MCDECASSLRLAENENPPEHHLLIFKKSKGYLFHPSPKLFTLISLLERATLTFLKTEEVCSETLFKITAAVEELSPLPLIECDEHRIMFMHRIISFYLTTRMFFIAKKCNNNDSIENKKTRERRQLSKLSYAPDEEINVNVTKEIEDQNCDKNKSKTQKRRKKSNTNEVVTKKIRQSKQKIKIKSPYLLIILYKNIVLILNILYK